MHQLRFAIDAHICVHKCHFILYLYVSCEITHYVCRGFQKDGFSEHIAFLSLFSLGYPIKSFLQGCLASGVHDEVAGHKMYQP